MLVYNQRHKNIAQCKYVLTVKNEREGHSYRGSLECEQDPKAILNRFFNLVELGNEHQLSVPSSFEH